MKKVISVFLSICIAFSICLTPGAVTADAASSNLMIEETDAVELLENEISSGQGGYTYNAPEPGKFLIENTLGTISITNGGPVLQFAGHTVTMPAVDYYKIVDNDGNLRYYQADVLKDQTQSGDFVYIALYVENGTDYTLHVQYMVETGERMYNTVVPLSVEQYTYFAQLSAPFSIGTDDVSDRLKLSARIYTYGSFEPSVNTVTYNVAEPMALNPIDNGTYDSYTNDDGIIHEYVSEHFADCFLENSDIYTDDPIVRIIPKELFFIPGEHIYVGKEYGFFLHVVTDAYLPPDYAVGVMVFDITHTDPGYGENDAGIANVRPLFHFKYRASRGERVDIDPTLTSAVFPHFQCDMVEYFLKNVGFKITVDNVDELNAGDAGYTPIGDNGAFIVQSRVNVSGVGKANAEENFVHDTANFVFGLIPYVGTGLSVLTYMHELANGFGNNEYADTREASTSDNEGNIVTLIRNHYDQISTYEHLIKTVSARTVSDENNPCLIHVGGGYAEIRYEINRKDGSDNDKVRIISSISVAVVTENPGAWSDGEIIEYGRATGTYETGNYKRLQDILPNGILSITIPASQQKHIIKMTPLVSGSYKISTSSNSGDPNFYITNATKGTATVVATDDISSTDRDAELIIDLIAGDIYYIEAFNYNRYHSYTLNIGYSPVSTQVLEANTSYNVTTTKGTYQMLKFTPSVSGYYEISTNRTSGDPQVFIFLTKGSLLDSDDDSGGNLNSYLRLYLSAGVTFYIAVQGYRGNAASFSITASLQE